LFAVGDDDQNIYAFNGASVEFIRRFAEDYKARPSYLIENYRSTRHIIGAANLVIAPAADRLKAEHAIEVNKARRTDPAGGELERIDPVGTGRVQILSCPDSPTAQALAAMGELERLASLHNDWDWAHAAIIAREWRFLEPVRAYCELEGIPVQMADEESPGFWRLRETQALIAWIQAHYETMITANEITTWISAQRSSPWNDLLLEAVAAYAVEAGPDESPIPGFIEWLAEWGRQIRRRQKGLLLLSAHRAKGLEFDHVVVLDGAWNKSGVNEDRQAARRLYYVAMTRARKSLCLIKMGASNAFLSELHDAPCLLRRVASDRLPVPAGMHRRYQDIRLGDVDLGFAGRFPSFNIVHRAIERAHPGDALQLVARNSGLDLLDQYGITVGRMSRAFTPIDSPSRARIEIAAVITRKKEDSTPEFYRNIRCEKWETVIPAFIYE